VAAKKGRMGVWSVSVDIEALTFAAVDGDETVQILRTDLKTNLDCANRTSITLG